jgi:hypothetical protein
MRSLRLALALLCACVASAFVLAPSSVLAQPVNCCLLPDNGGGTADLPPNCSVGYNGVGVISNGFPAGSGINIVARLHTFTGVFSGAGGFLGGEIEQWSGSTLDLTLTGTGIFSSYSRFLQLPTSGQTHSAPRTPFAPVQSFNTLLYGLQGQITGDPDFDLLRVTAGNGFGMPSPGQTTFTTSSGAWLVDSYLDITYRVDFIGRSTGPFAGYSGSTVNNLEHFTMCHEDATPSQATSWGGVKAIYR